MNPAQAKQMVLDSDYPTDKVVYLRKGSFTIASTNTGGSTISHGLSFIPLLGGNWSLTPDFAITYEFGSGPFPSTLPGYFFSAQVDIYADTTSVYINGQNLSSGSITVYYRVFAFEPTTSSADIPSTSNSGDNFTLSSDFNLTKLYMEGFINGVVTTSSIARTSFTHGLGYIPQVLAWRENIYDQTLPLYYATPGNDSLVTGLIVNATNIIVLTPKFTNDNRRIHYRIYLDE